jgi:RNA polymerase sigma-70 factor (ECF subfamily)
MLFRKSLSGLSDEELVIRFQQGEGRALDVLYQRYGSPLLRFLYRMLWRDAQRAKDALQDIFVKVLERPMQVDPARKFSTWLYAVAHNYCKNEYRKEANRDAAMLNQIISPTHTDFGGDQMDQAVFRRALDKLLDEEGELARTIIVLRYEMDLELDEIASVLNCPEGTVKSRLFYLRQRLAQSLGPYKIMLEK